MSIELVYDREEAGKYFAKLRNLTSVRGGTFCFEDENVVKERDKKILELAKELLGQDWDCPIYT